MSNNYYYGGGWHVRYPNSPIKWVIALALIGIAGAPFFLMGTTVGLWVVGSMLAFVATIAFLGAKVAAGLVLGLIFGFLTWLIVPDASGWVGLVAFLLTILN